MTSPVNEPDFVRAQYETEHRLRARKSAYVNAEGDDPRELAFEAVTAAAPGRVLEVGGGEGELAERIMSELGAEVVGIDQSPRMVEIQRSRGIDARVGDVQDLPFATMSSTSRSLRGCCTTSRLSTAGLRNWLAS